MCNKYLQSTTVLHQYSASKHTGVYKFCLHKGHSYFYFFFLNSSNINHSTWLAIDTPCVYSLVTQYCNIQNYYECFQDLTKQTKFKIHLQDCKVVFLVDLMMKGIKDNEETTQAT